MSAPGGRRPLAAGNWKMNLNHLEAIALVQKVVFSLTDRDLSAVDVAFLPPFTSLRSVQTLVEGDKLPVAFGGQDISQHDAGAYTGEISGPMLAKLDCTYVVVGHSERRSYHGEGDGIVLAKAQAAFRHGLTPIVCVGEALEIRVGGGHIGFVTSSLDGSVGGLTPDQAAKVVIAYEPVWAIGTGRTASPADAQEMCAALRSRLAGHFGDSIAGGVRILYGGSVTAENSTAILGQTDVDGALVGGASLKAEAFADIVRAAVARTKLES